MMQKAHVRVWNYETLETISVIGNKEEFQTSISCLSFSSLDGGEVQLAIADSEQKPNLTVWSGVETSDPEMVAGTVASSESIFALKHLKGRQNVMVSVGENHLNIWTLSESMELTKKRGLFTRKIPRPKAVTCLSFAARSNEILTGDTDGNVMIWNGVKVVRVLKGAHKGPVGDIGVMQDGSLVSGGKKDGAFVVFNSSYELIGAGAAIPSKLKTVRYICPVNLKEEEDGCRFYHLLVGTTSNCVADVTFSLHPDSTDIRNFEVEVLIQGHCGAIFDVQQVSEDEFISCGEGHVVLWDAVAHKAKYSHLLHGEVVNCVATSSGGQLAAGTENGIVHFGTKDSHGMNFKMHHSVSDEAVMSMAFSPDELTLAVGCDDKKIYLLKFFDRKIYSDYDLFELQGHSAGVTHLDWSLDSKHLRSNSRDYELLFWDATRREDQQITDGDALDAIESSWCTHHCTMTFDTMGIWPVKADGTDVNATDCSADHKVVAAANDFGTVQVYQFPCNQTKAKSLELRGHSSHVTGVAFLPGSSRMVSCGGSEGSIIQRAFKDRPKMRKQSIRSKQK